MPLTLSGPAAETARARLGMPIAPLPPMPAVAAPEASTAPPVPKPPVAAKSTWRARYDARADALAATMPDWPSALPRHAADQHSAVPLAMGTYAALLARTDGSDAARRAVGALLCILCRSKGYLMALAAEGAQRHALDGTPVELVTDEHRDGAKAALAMLFARKQP
jgi:RNA chaperone ProQ/FINO-like protein